MSYKKMMKWHKKHPKGTKQTVIMHANSGFWASSAYLEEYVKYVNNCNKNSTEPLDCEMYYKSLLK